MSILCRDAALYDLIDLAYHIAHDNLDAAYRTINGDCRLAEQRL
jgi:hypothetical protein